MDSRVEYTLSENVIVPGHKLNFIRYFMKDYDHVKQVII